MPAHYRVIQDYTSEYPDPIMIRAGEHVTATDRVDLWQNNPEWVWIWCRDQRGKEGFIPPAYLDGDGSERVARRDYSARELDAQAGQTVLALAFESGWAWCRDEAGNEGWLPLSVLQEAADDR